MLVVVKVSAPVIEAEPVIEVAKARGAEATRRSARERNLVVLFNVVLLGAGSTRNGAAWL